jgi:hypothetical protein
MSQWARLWGRLGSARHRQSAVMVGLLISLASSGVHAWRASGPEVWRARYFHGFDRKGRAVVREYPHLAFDWGRGVIDEAIRKNAISARFESCLTLEQPALLTFFLEAKDGAMLEVDGRLVASTWHKRSLGRRTGSIELGAGEHLLQVDWYKDLGAGRLLSLVSLDQGPFRSLDSRLLRQPREQGAPCPSER